MDKEDCKNCKYFKKYDNPEHTGYFSIINNEEETIYHGECLNTEQYHPYHNKIDLDHQPKGKWCYNNGQEEKEIERQEKIQKEEELKREKEKWDLMQTIRGNLSEKIESTKSRAFIDTHYDEMIQQAELRGLRTAMGIINKSESEYNKKIEFRVNEARKQMLGY